MTKTVLILEDGTVFEGKGFGYPSDATGEVACFGKTFYDALKDSMISSGFKFPKKGDIILVFGEGNKKTCDLIKRLSKKYKILTNVCHRNGVEKMKFSEDDLIKLIENQKIKLTISLIEDENLGELQGFIIRRKSIDMNIPLITNLEMAKMFVKVS